MKYQHIEATEVVAQCYTGAVLSECVCEAIVMAVTEMRTVTFKHNDREYVVKPKNLIDGIYKQHEA